MLDFTDPDTHDGRCASAAICPAVQRDRGRRGARNHLAGLAAEDTVLRTCLARGLTLVHRRWRGSAGEIDLILRDGGEYVVVEVKASRTFDDAMARITPAQVRRLYKAAEQFLSGRPEGPFACVRFDAALVDGAGRVEILENALLPY